jgi:small subunit ribosomal protein S9
VTVNDRDADEYFVTNRARNAVRGPLRATKSLNRFDILATIKGGGITSQAEAMVLGIARALVKIDATFHETLKDEGYLTRDDRKKERKKYGRRGARAGFQFSKR